MVSSRSFFHLPNVHDIQRVSATSQVLWFLHSCVLGENFLLPSYFLQFLQWCKTLFLFTKSDFQTIIIPVIAYAASIAPLRDFSLLPHVAFWTWLHVLQCALSNQSFNPEEDAINKPYRPIPSGRITLLQTRVLRWATVPVCFALSACYGLVVLKASIYLIIYLYIYNDLEFNAHWLSRNLLNGAGLACLETGATVIARHDQPGSDTNSEFAIAVSTCIFVTTIQAQDFKDQPGDMKIGRRTLPMIFPTASRVLMFFSLIAWSIGLVYLWNTPPLIAYIFLAMGTLVGTLFLCLRSVSNDKKSFQLYNIWLSMAYALPALTTKAA